MKFVIGSDLKEFRKYYKTIRDELENTEEIIIKENPSHLIVWKEDQNILGHAIWHESSIKEHRKGYPRDELDSKLLENLLKGKTEFIELHEIWLREEYRGKGYGKRFFEFFEEYITSMGHNSIIYYANDPSAIAICHKRGYKEMRHEKSNLTIFCKSKLK